MQRPPTDRWRAAPRSLSASAGGIIGNADELRMRMIEPRAGGAAVILEDHDAHEPRVALQILHPRPPRPQHAPQAIGVERVQRLIVDRRFDDHFVRAEAVARFEQAVGTHVGLAFDAQHRMTIRHDAHRPSRHVGRPALAPREDLRTGIGFASFAERTLRRRILEPHRLELEIIPAPERPEIDRHRSVR